MKPLSQTDKLILTAIVIVIISIIGWIVWPMFQGRQITNTNTVVPQNENINTSNINTANANSQPVNLNTNVDTSAWKTYRNEELNLVFSYPEEFGGVILTHKTKTSDSAVRSGESLYLSFDKNPYITIQAATSDYEEFKGFYYTGGEDLGLKCKEEFTVINSTICQETQIAKQKTYELIRLVQDEGVAMIIREIRLNLSTPKYNGLVINQAWNEVAQALENYTSAPNSELIVRDYLNRLIKNENLSKTTIEENLIFKRFVDTIL